MSNKKLYGKLIGASLGPGDPLLITRRSWDVLQSSARWLYPVKKAEESSYALSIVERGGLAVPKDAVELVFPMTRDATALLKAQRVGAYRRRTARRRPRRRLSGRGRRVDLRHFRSSGASCPRAGARSRGRDDSRRFVFRRRSGERRSSARRRGRRAGDHSRRLRRRRHRPPARRVRYAGPAQGQAADRRSARTAERRGLIATSCFIEKVGSPDERIVRDVAQLRDENVNCHLSLLLVQNPKRQRGELRRGCRRRAQEKVND